MSVINIIGIILVIVLLALSLFNVSLSKIIIVLFISSLGLFVVRMTIENKDFLDAFYKFIWFNDNNFVCRGYRQFL